MDMTRSMLSQFPLRGAALLPLALGALALAPRPAVGQNAAYGAGAAILPPAQQITLAVLPLPKEMRDGASVLGYGADGRLTRLREGSGDMTCLASDPKSERFHVACYHKSLEPFMARGRALRAGGVTGTRVDSVRFAEAKAGTLVLPDHPAALYSISGGTVDLAAGTATGGRPLYVVYIPYATAASTGLSTMAAPGAPWIMLPGTPKAHIMFTPGM
jgi:hypothetical protein